MTYKMKVYVGEEEIAIRGGAGNDTAIVARAQPRSALQATGELGRWIRVELPQQRPGWVHRSGITFEPLVQPAASQMLGGVIYILQPQIPLIAVAKPLNDSIFNISRIEVSGVIADDQAVSGTEFKLNGREIDFVRIRGVAGIGKTPLSTQRGVNFSFWINLADGKNEIEIIAWDNEGLKAQKKITVTYEKDRGNVYVVCIGIDKYKNVRPAKYAVADAQDMADCLRRRLRVPEKNIDILLNEKATLECIKETIGVKVRKHAGRADTVVIYFAGHGASEPDDDSPDGDGMAKYLLPFEARSSSLFPTALAMEDVIRLFRRLVSERVVFLVDTCFSGAIGGRTLRSTEAEFRSIDINQDNLLKRLRDTGTGRVILTACRGTEASQAKDELGHGVFTYYLLRGLEGKADNNEDGIITITELYQYVSAEVPKATKNTQYPMIKLGEMAGEIIVSMVEEVEH